MSQAYTNDHSQSVLQTHSWRDVSNSAPYLLSHLQPTMTILDVGCGPGSITIDLARKVPRGHVVGVEYVSDPLDGARSLASSAGLTNVRFHIGDIYDLLFPGNSFDVVHAHQVLQHIADPVQAFKEMRRVVKPGGIVAVQEMEWYCTLSDHLLSKDGLTVGKQSFDSVVGQIRQAIIALFKKLLLYQMKSVCSYYRNQGLTFLREIGKWDDWDGELNQVTNAESVVLQYSNQHCKEHSKSALTELVEYGNKLQQELREINMTLRDFYKSQIEARKEDKDAECLQELKTVDPQYDVDELEGEKTDC
ncbi:methyltransferase-UbiE family protein [Aspergillus affinis]|uniref:methyltransferase-UbiE family protein n=1 Tax=Aspergillus affinis TaxID=1070780 RepID=UPI0022FE7195|nr:methyltransferase-UbiE family protein [Aspergillus affinis]KAI9040783.1 methyltransferase-UbiE family protein [Aspergillus affinis]